MNNLIQIDPQNKAGKIKLNDIVMQPVMDKLIDELGKIFGASAAASGSYTGELTNYAENAVDTLEIVIHSPGGSVLDGYTLYNEVMDLRSRGVHVTATINSLAASMASVIAMAADVVRIVPNGRMMIHDVSQGVRGNSEELSKAAKLCDDMSNQIAEIYAGKSGKPVSEMRDLMKAETWLNAKEAISLGLANEIFDIQPKKQTKASMNILKVLFPGNEAEISQVEAALAEVDSLRNDVAMYTSEVATLKADITAKDQTIAENVASIGTLNESITALTTEKADLTAALETASSDLAAKDAEIEEAKVSAAKLATETLASIGQPEPLTIEPSENQAKTITLEAFNQMKPSAKMEYCKQGGIIKG